MYIERNSYVYQKYFMSIIEVYCLCKLRVTVMYIISITHVLLLFRDTKESIFHTTEYS